MATYPKLFALSIVVASAGCGGSESKESTGDVVRPAKTWKVTAPSAGGDLVFPATLQAGDENELAMQVGGELVKFDVKQGDTLEKGQVIAKLDSQLFSVAVQKANAAVLKAKADYDRGMKLYETDGMSKQDLDALRAARDAANADLRAARVNLGYATLKAPYTGRVAKTLVSNHENVQAKQPLLIMQTEAKVEIHFDVPESVLARVPPGAGTELKASVSIEAKPETSYPAEYLEHSTSIDADTQTYAVRYVMERPTDLAVLPGMTATITVVLPGDSDTKAAAFRVPNSAVFKRDGKSHVWIVAPDAMTVSLSEVTLGQLGDGTVEVLTGVTEGQEIVVAGVAYLSAGQKIKRLDGTPQ